MSRLVPSALVALASTLLLPAPARAQNIANWTFGTQNFPGVQTGPQFAPDMTAANVTALNFDVARGGGATPRGWFFYDSIDGFNVGSALASDPNVAAQRPTFG